MVIIQGDETDRNTEGWDTSNMPLLINCPIKVKSSVIKSKVCQFEVK